VEPGPKPFCFEAGESDARGRTPRPSGTGGFAIGLTEARSSLPKGERAGSLDPDHARAAAAHPTYDMARRSSHPGGGSTLRRL